MNFIDIRVVLLRIVRRFFYVMMDREFEVSPSLFKPFVVNYGSKLCMTIALKEKENLNQTLFEHAWSAVY